MTARLRWNGSQEAYEEHLKALRSLSRRPSKKAKKRRTRAKRASSTSVQKKPDFGALDEEFLRLVKSF